MLFVGKGAVIVSTSKAEVQSEVALVEWQYEVSRQRE
jgi:hypothetical protein